MTDLHCHILPGIDDGSKNVEMSLQLLKEEAKQGVKRIAFTPHFHFERITIPEFIANRQGAIEKLSAALEKEPVPIEFRYGAEIFFSPTLLQENLDPLCFTGTKVLLVELPVNFYPQWTIDVIYRLRNMGYIPFIAHVERYRYVIDNPNLLCDFIDAGAYIQVNATSIVNHKHRCALIMKMIRHDMVHVLSTDTHSPDKRPPLLQEAFEIVARKCGKDTVQQLCCNAKELFCGEEPDINEPEKLKQLFGKWI